MDDCILLYSSITTSPAADHSADWLNQASIIELGAPTRDPLKDPSRADLLAAVKDAGIDGDVGAFFAEAAIAKQDEFRVKVRIQELSYDIPRISRPLTLRIAPYSQWLERTFNRELLRTSRDMPPPTVAPQNLHERLLNQTLAGWPNDKLELKGPGPLFLEGCLVTRDNELLLFKKRPQSGGTFLQIGRPWTCGFEVGLEWADLSPKPRPDPASLSFKRPGPLTLDTGALLLSALALEFGLTGADILSVTWHGIALECHFSTALVCTVQTGMTSAELLGTLKQAKGPSGDYATGHLVKGVAAVRAVFGSAPRGTRPKDDWPAADEWHSSARLRVLLALRTMYGKQAAHALIDGALGGSVPWSDR